MPIKSNRYSILVVKLKRLKSIYITVTDCLLYEPLLQQYWHSLPYLHSEGTTTNPVPGFQHYRIEPTGFQQLCSTQTCRKTETPTGLKHKDSSNICPFCTCIKWQQQKAHSDFRSLLKLMTKMASKNAFLKRNIVFVPYQIAQNQIKSIVWKIC